jgi:hypothetical protein
LVSTRGHHQVGDDLELMLQFCYFLVWHQTVR